MGAKKHKGTTHPNSFYGSDFIDWIIEEEKVDRERGRELAQSLLDSGLEEALGGEFCLFDLV